MQLLIPSKLNGEPYQRYEMEAYLRENMLSKNHMILRQFALKYYKLNPDFFLSCPINIILHWILDRMIDESSKSDQVKVVGEKFGLAPTRNSDIYKIKGFDPRGNNDEFLQEYTKLLAQFISRKLALMPNDNEGIRVEEINRYIEPNSEGFIPPPSPPGVNSFNEITPVNAIPIINTPMPQPMPPPPTRKPRGRPPAKPLEKPTEMSPSPHVLTVELLSKSIRAEIAAFEDKFVHLQDHITSLENRIFALETKK